MSPFAYDVVGSELVPVEPLALAALVAAHATGATLVDARKREDGNLRLVFDRNVSQALIVDMLELLLTEASE